MLNQFAHADTISALADNTTPRAQSKVICITGNVTECNTLDHLHRESDLNNPACSIATRGHPHTGSADTRHSYVTHLIEDGFDALFGWIILSLVMLRVCELGISVEHVVVEARFATPAAPHVTD
ncbi:hypothetical protein [Embleya scabrispora]|uniref:hypothetical protein n=1 Tax=Embleya scabrispora TaxID=159449 RepID=UPI001319DA26|nr:hypothetical protein [Embleya scabrispora]MYS80030.1 hypothetical protein [Streptomyces sp. SID5474]